MNSVCRIFWTGIILFFSFNLQSQTYHQNSVDGIVAVVGKNIIMHSDIESALAEYTSQYGNSENVDEVRCNILKRLMVQELLVHQSVLDSIIVTDQEVEDQINYRLSAYIAQVGDVKIIEDFYKKKIADIKKDMKEIMRDQILAERVKSTILDQLKITPTEVKDFYNKIPYDSLPTINEQFEFGHILKIPKMNETQIQDIKNRLEDYRQKILNGEYSFSTLARLYSEDPGSASKGGNLGFVERGQLYSEFEAVAFALKTGEISHIVETQAGYHIIQMIERRGDAINVSHILLRPKASMEEQVASLEYLDSIYNIITKNDTVAFSKNAELYSEDENKINGGLVVNSYTGNYKFELEHLDQATAMIIKKMAVETYSKPVPYQTENGNQAYRILYLKSKIPAHKPNMVEDYDIIKNAALEDKKEKVLELWVKNKVKTTNIKISEIYDYCNFINEWNIPK